MPPLEEIKVESRENKTDGSEHTAREGRKPDRREFNIDFLKKCDENLNTTLMVAGLLSAAISASVTYIQPQLQLNPTEGFVALLRALIFRKDDTIFEFFEGDVPQISHWIGPPLTIILTQVLLSFSLAATLMSVLLTLVAKLVLNLCASTRLWKPNTERVQRWQTWLPLHVEAALFASPLLLQLALFTFSLALFMYLRMVDLAIAILSLFLTLGFLTLYASSLHASCEGRVAKFYDLFI